MTAHPRPDDFDRLLTGEGAPDVVGEFLARLRDDLIVDLDDDKADEHLDAIVATALAHAHDVPGPASIVRPWRRRVAHVLGLTATKVAVGVGIAAAATGGLAATDSLPDPVQRVVSDGGSYLGFDFPYPTVDTPVTQLPDPETGVPGDQPADDRSDSARGAEVDAPDEGELAPADDPDAEAPPFEVPASDAPPVDIPSDDPDPEDGSPPDGPGDRPESPNPVNPDDPPTSPPAGEDEPPPATSGP